MSMSARRSHSQRQQLAPAPEPSLGPDALAAAFQHAQIGIAIAAADGRLRDVNPALLRMLGHERDEVLALHIDDITHPEDRSEDAVYRSRLSCGEVDAYQREKRYMRKDGSTLWALITVSALRDDAGRFLGSSAQIQDITAQKMAESALREHEARLGALVGRLPVVLYSQPWGGPHVLHYVSPEFTRQTGLGPSDIPMSTASLLERAHPDDRAHLIAVNERSNRTGETAQAVYRLRGGHGDWVWIDHRSVLMRDAAGRPLAWHGSLIDISERKRLEASLRESDLRFRRAFEDSAIGMALGTPDDVCLDVNEAYCAIMGRPREAIIGHSFQEFTYPEDRQPQTDRLAQMIAGEASSFILEKRYVRPDGEIVTALVTISAIRDEGGDLLYCVGQIQDITAQKAAEASLRESEDLLRTVVEQVPAAVYRLEVGPAGRFTFTSARFAQLTGLALEGGETRIGDYFARVHPDDIEIVRNADVESTRTGQPFDIEYRLQNGKGEWIWVHDRSVPMRDADGRIVAWHGVLLDITEQKRLESALHENEARLRLLVEQLPVALFSVDVGPNQHYTYVSPQFASLTGMSAAEIARGTAAFFERIHHDDVEAVRAFDRRLSEATGPYEIAYRARRPDGGWVWLQERAMLARDARGKPLAWNGVLIDVSAQRQLEDSLRESEARFRSTFEGASIGMVLSTPDGRNLIANRALERLLGYGPGGLAGVHSDDITVPDDLEEQYALRERLRSGEFDSYQFEKRLRRTDGSLVWVVLDATAIRDGRGNVQTVIAQIQDITARKEAEEALRASEARFRSTFESAGIGMTLVDSHGTFLDANPAFCRFIGYSHDELMRLSSLDITHPDDRLDSEDHIRRLNAGELDGFSMEKRYRRADGRIVWGDLTITALRGVDGQAEMMIGQVQDITARKAAEEALRESEARFRSAFAGAGIGMSLAGMDGRFFDANPAFCRFLGYTRDELLTLTYLDITHPDDRDVSLDYTRRLFQQELASYAIEKRYLRADGRTVWGQLTITTVDGPDGMPLYEIAQVQDITARKEAEAALRESEARFRSTFESAGIGMTLVDPNGTFLDANPAFCRFLGYTRDELRRLTSLAITHPEDRDVDAAWIRRMDDGVIDTYRMEKRYLRADGATLWGDLTVTAMHASDGRILHRIAQIQDITARKEAETARRESEARFASIFEDAGIGMTIADAEGRIRLVNPAMAKFLGYSAGELIGVLLDGLTYADDLPEQRDKRQRTVAGDIDAYQLEKRYVRKDGTLAWGLVNASAVRNASGAVQELIGQVQDITARKEAEAALRESEARFRALVQNDPDVIVVIDAAMRITYVSPSSLAALGVLPETVIGETAETFIDRVHPEDIDRALALFGDVGLRQGTVASTEVRVQHAAEGWRWFQITIANLLGHPGVSGFLFNLRDITERKHADLATAAALQTQQAAIAELERLNRSKSRFLSTISHEFRTPLTAIIGYSEFMTHNAGDAALIAEDAAVIHREASRLNRMVDEVLLIDRVDSGQMSLRTKPVAPNAIVLDVVESCRPLFEKHELVLDLDPAARIVDGDRDRLAQAITNLISNAIKYSPDGGPITVTTRNEGADVVISVRDVGIGIAPEDLGRIFDRFERVESGIAGRIGGTGLGLSIVREIAKLHGGRVWAESEPGFGSVFSLAIPASEGETA